MFFSLGKWNKFGILTNANNVFDYTLATLFHKEAEWNGFDVTFFDIVPDIEDDVIENLLESGTRIIVVDISIPSMILKFLCKSYKLGMTGGKYVFILFHGSFFEPTAMPESVVNCTRQEIFEQLKYSFWLGWSLSTENANFSSSLNMTLSDFDDRFHQYFPDDSIPADFNKRTSCHDAALATVLALDKTDKELVKRNQSLLDYSQHSQSIMRIANRSLSTSDFNGLRNGHFHYSKIDGELKSDNFAAFQWTEETGTVMVARFIMNSTIQINGQNVNNYSVFTCELLTEPMWFTEDQEPPSDGAKDIVRVSTIPEPVYFGIIASVVLQSIVQIYFVITSIFEKVGGKWLYLCCVTFNLTSVSLAITDTQAVWLCYLQRIFALFSLALLQIVVLPSMLYNHINYKRLRKYMGYYCQMAAMLPGQELETMPHFDYWKNQYLPLKKRDKSGTVTVLGRMRTVRILPCIIQKPLDSLDERQLIRFRYSTGFVFFILTTIVLILWLRLSTPQVYLFHSIDQLYDPVKDYFITVDVYACYEFVDNSWVFSICATHIILLLYSSAIAYQLRNYNTTKTNLVTETSFDPNLTAFRYIALANTSILIGTVFVYLVLFPTKTIDVIMLFSIICTILPAIMNIIFVIHGNRICPSLIVEEKAAPSTETTQRQSEVTETYFN